MSWDALRLLTAAVVIVYVGQFHLAGAVDHPQIVFAELYSVVFTGNFLSRCLCNESVKSCTAEYTLDPTPGTPYYYKVDEIDDESIDEEDSNYVHYGTTYQCHPGQFNAKGEITCIRLKQNEQGCVTSSGPNVCRGFGVPTTHRRCDLTCVDILWSGYTVSFVNFPSDEEPKPGSCAGSTPMPRQTTTTTRETVSETTTLENPTTSKGSGGGAVSMKNDDDGGGDNSLALGIGLGCAFIGVIVAVFAAIVVFWRRKRKRDASLNKPTLPYIQHPHANNTYSTTSGKRKFSTGENGADYDTYLEPVHIYAQVTEEDAHAGVYENIGDVERGRSTRKDGAAAFNGSRVAVMVVKDSSTSGSSTSNKPNAHPYDIARSLESSSADADQGKKKEKKTGKKDGDGKKKGGGGDRQLINDYNRLHTGRSGKGEEVSRSILARYNNPPTPPASRDDDEDDESVYEGYDDDYKDEEEAMKVQAQETSMNAYSMATPIDEGNEAQATETGDGRHLGKTQALSPYQNLRLTAPQGVINPAFTSDTPGHEYLTLEEDVKSIREGEKGTKQINSNKSNNSENNRSPGDYFELEKDTNS